MNVTLGNKVDRTEFIGLENRINDLENNTSLYALQTDTNAILNRLHNIDNYIPTKLNISEFEIHVAMKTDPHTNWYPPFEKMANQITAYRLNANGDRIMAIDSIVTDMITNENVTDEKIARLNVYGSGMNNDNQDHSHIATETIGPNNLATSSVYGYKNNGDDTDFSKSRQRSIIAYRTIGDENIDVLEIFGSVRKINNQYQINPGASKIAERTIGNYNIDDDAITSNKIAAGQIYGSWRERNGVLNSSTGSLNDSTSDIHLYTIGTNNIHDSAVTTPKIADSNVTTAKINNSAVTTEKINNSAVTTAKIADSNVTTAKINNSAVTTEKINNSAVTTEKINNSAVTTEKIANGNVTTVKLADSAVTTPKIADSNITTAKINNSAVTTDKIANGNVTTVKLADSAVTTAKIANNAVTTAKIADRNVTTVKLADGAVTTAKIANRNVTAAKLADDVLSMFNTIEGSINVINNTVNSLELKPHSVTGTGTTSSTNSIIAGSTVGTWNLANNAVTTAKIANYSVTNDKIDTNTITKDRLAFTLDSQKISIIYYGVCNVKNATNWTIKTNISKPKIILFQHLSHDGYIHVRVVHNDSDSRIYPGYNYTNGSADYYIGKHMSAATFFLVNSDPNPVFQISGGGDDDTNWNNHEDDPAHDLLNYSSSGTFNGDAVACYILFGFDWYKMKNLTSSVFDKFNIA